MKLIFNRGLDLLCVTARIKLSPGVPKDTPSDGKCAPISWKNHLIRLAASHLVESSFKCLFSKYLQYILILTLDITVLCKLVYFSHGCWSLLLVSRAFSLLLS